MTCEFSASLVVKGLYRLQAKGGFDDGNFNLLIQSQLYISGHLVTAKENAGLLQQIVFGRGRRYL